MLHKRSTVYNNDIKAAQDFYKTALKTATQFASPTAADRAFQCRPSHKKEQRPHHSRWYRRTVNKTRTEAFNISHLECHQFLHDHSVLKVQSLGVSVVPPIVIAEGVKVNALKLRDSQFDRSPVTLKLLDVVSQFLFVDLREVRVNTACS